MLVQKIEVGGYSIFASMRLARDSKLRALKRAAVTRLQSCLKLMSKENIKLW